MSAATFTTTCARCAAPLEVTDATVDYVVKAHEARCSVPMPFLPVKFDEPKPDDHIEIRMRASMVPVKMTYGMFYVDPDPVPPTDPLDVKYDGETLRDIVAAYELLQREHHLVQRNAAGDIVRYGESMPLWFMCQNGEFTPAQRAAVSAHWSAELRAKVAASKERERMSVVNERDAEDEPWR